MLSYAPSFATKSVRSGVRENWTIARQQSTFGASQPAMKTTRRANQQKPVQSRREKYSA
jgi:hypothetical protein